MLAALFALQSELQDKKTASLREASIKVNKVIGTLSREDMARYLRSYAQKDKRLNVHLKLLFADRITDIDSKQKYDSLFKQIARQPAKSNQAISIQGYQQIIRLLDDLENKIYLYIASQDFLEASSCLRAIMERFVPHLKYESALLAGLDEFLYKYLNIATEVLKSALSPQLRDELTLGICHALGIGMHHSPKMYQFAIKIIAESDAGQDWQQILNQNITNSIRKIDQHIIPQILIEWYSACGEHEALLEFCKQSLSEYGSLLVETIFQAIDAKHLKAAEFFIEQAQEVLMKPDYKAKLAKN